MVDILQKNVIIILWAWHRAPAKDSKGEKQMLKKMKNNKKGFTLVELIVVLVILAILAALLIPALTGYIKKAKEKSVIAETRQAVMAAQTLVDEKYGTISLGAGTTIAVTAKADEKDTDTKIYVKTSEIETLAELTKGTVKSAEVSAEGKVTALTYERGGQRCVYDASKAGTSGAYTVTEAK